MIFPFLWILVSSVKTQIDIISWPPEIHLYPDPGQLRQSVWRAELPEILYQLYSY